MSGSFIAWVAVIFLLGVSVFSHLQVIGCHEHLSVTEHQQALRNTPPWERVRPPSEDAVSCPGLPSPLWSFFQTALFVGLEGMKTNALQLFQVMREHPQAQQLLLAGNVVFVLMEDALWLWLVVTGLWNYLLKHTSWLICAVVLFYLCKAGVSFGGMVSTGDTRKMFGTASETAQQVEDTVTVWVMVVVQFVSQAVNGDQWAQLQHFQRGGTGASSSGGGIFSGGGGVGWPSAGSSIRGWGVSGSSRSEL
uniref:Uncharacterized protein n=1 Tax=Chromera velia CCMP2878 TaxID=1169474 RepID=A0A0G4HPN3_9ALVE|eukprot:Cvel_7831.t1-p1 / transcript=Cvel_7831.t1 / gene=Cvel_7831 / organism=Chromera_velia_CCMP2878 / gene_product=hypothetical protein / transcript_product=hypothetical protein / location=Cvel_scaffold418:67172-69337(-) / protein_length=249 / sequence_SO=supercontig / SO=protein_coding / is_pseudo=false